MLTLERNNRIVVVNSTKGLRKKYIVIQAVKYCIVRGFFKDGAYNIESGGTNNCHTFLNLLLKKLKLTMESLDDLCQMIDQKDMALVINDCQQILAHKKEKTKFEKILQDLLEKTKFVKIVVVFEGEHELLVNGMPPANRVSIKPLARRDAARFLKSLDKEDLLEDADALSMNELFNTSLSNQELIDIYQVFRKKQTSLKEIQSGLVTSFQR